MNFELSEDQLILQQNLKKFCSKELLDLAIEIEKKTFLSLPVFVRKSQVWDI